jgi:hypothetical protein
MKGFERIMRINHRLSRTGLTNVRPDLGFAERKRGVSALVCGSLQLPGSEGGVAVPIPKKGDEALFFGMSY